MARVNLMKNIVTSRRQPHTPLDNVNTPYNPIRWACYSDDHWKVSYFVSQTAEGGASRPGGGQPLHQRALHREDRQPQARHQVSQAPCHGRGEPPHWSTSLQLTLKYSKHLLSCKLPLSLSLLQACEDEYDYHHKLFGQGAVDRYFLFSSIPTFVDNLPAPGCSYIWSYFRDFQFHNPQLVKDYVNQIRRV